jgi:hypothetical protein
MQKLHGQDQTLILTTTHQDSLDTVKRSTSNAHSLSNREKRMDRKGKLFSNGRLKIFYLCARDWRPDALASHKAKHAWNPQHP